MLVGRLVCERELLGTAFFVGERVALTTLHCVGQNGRVKYPSASICVSAARGEPPLELPVHVADWDEQLDVAVLGLPSKPPQGLPTASLGSRVDQGQEFYSKGYPQELESLTAQESVAPDSFTIHGVVADADRSLESLRFVTSAAVLQLTVHNATSFHLNGMSGAPVLVDNRVVGMVRWQMGDDRGYARANTVYAVRMSAILDRWPDLRAYVVDGHDPEPKDDWFQGILGYEHSSLIGREHEEARVIQYVMSERILRGRDEIGASRARVCVIVGPPGSGKTALAYQVAVDLCRERNSSAFRNGWLDANVRGYVAGEDAQDNAADVLRTWLRQLEQSERNLDGACLSDLKARFEHALRQREVLFVLDNVRDHSSLSSLIPSNPGCAVVVTTRDSSGLDAYGSPRTVARLSLTRLDDDAACTLLLDGMPGTVDSRLDPTILDIAARKCGALPLAIVIARGICRENEWSITNLNNALSQGSALRLLELGSGPEVNVAENFSLSYRNLDRNEQKDLLLLASMPSNGFPEWAAAVFLDRPVEMTDAALHRLVRRSLLERLEPATERARTSLSARMFRFHDLVRQFALDLRQEMSQEIPADKDLTVAYERLGRVLTMAGAHAVARATGEDPPHSLAESPLFGTEIRTLIDFDATQWIRQHLPLFLQAATCSSGLHITQQTLALIAVIVKMVDLSPVELRDQTTYEEALRAGIATSSQIAMPGSAAKFRVALGHQLNYTSQWEAAEVELVRALDHARSIPDQPFEATVRALLGETYRERGRWHSAREQFELALAQFQRQEGDSLEESDTLLRLGRVYRYLGEWTQAAECFAQSLRQALARPTSPAERVAAVAHHDLADLRRDQGRLEEALEYLHKAESILRRQEDDLHLARVRSSYVDVYRDMHRWNDAQEAFTACDRVFERYGDRRWRGRTRLNLAISLRYKGDLESAQEELFRAFKELEPLGDMKGQAMCDECAGSILVWLVIKSSVPQARLLANARRKLDKALEYFTSSGERLWVAKTEWALARLAWADGNEDEALVLRRRVDGVCAVLGAAHPDIHEPITRGKNR